MIKRCIEENIREKFFKGKAILIFGARQTGKTTLVEMLLQKYKDDMLYLSGEDITVSELLRPSIENLKGIIGKKKIVFIDEAQKIDDIGVKIKLIVDHIKDVQVIATGSSAFDLANKTSESLTGRKYEYHLFPFSYTELCETNGELSEHGSIEQRLLYGTYPEVINSPGDEIEVLQLLSSSYLYKDLLMQESVKKPVVLEKIVRALAFQIGNEVNYNEIAKLVQADKITVEKYIDLLEKSFVIFRLTALSRNVRNEIKRGRKIYFYDNGIRNSVISNFKPVVYRDDVGALWENYLVSERVKLLSYNKFYGRNYFWRTTQQQEIDYIEEIDDRFTAFEFKWNSMKKAKIPLTFSKAYPNNTFSVITRENYRDFLSEVV